MTNHRYNTPAEGTINWHEPLNENFERLDRDVEIRDIEANRDEYQPESGMKYFATDTGATFTGDGSSWNLVGYVTQSSGGGVSHYVNYPDGITDEEINRYLLAGDEDLQVIRLSLPMKGMDDGATDSDVALTVYEGGIGGEPVVRIDGNGFKSAATDDSAPWVASTSPVSVTVSNMSGGPIQAAPKVWANIRRR